MKILETVKRRAMRWRLFTVAAVLTVLPILIEATAATAAASRADGALLTWLLWASAALVWVLFALNVAEHRKRLKEETGAQ
jgi:hypothetical protein